MVSYTQLLSYNPGWGRNNFDFWTAVSSSPAPSKKYSSQVIQQQIKMVHDLAKQQTKTTTTSNENQKLKNMIMTRR
jgi:hypothetical protein